MTDALNMIEFTIQLPHTTAARYATAAARRGTTAPAMIAELALRASENLLAPKARRLPKVSLRSRDSLSTSDGIAMLSMHFAGASPERIAAEFNISLDDAHEHLRFLTDASANPRKKRPPATIKAVGRAEQEAERRWVA